MVTARFFPKKKHPGSVKSAVLRSERKGLRCKKSIIILGATQTLRYTCIANLFTLVPSCKLRDSPAPWKSYTESKLEDSPKYANAAPSLQT